MQVQAVYLRERIEKARQGNQAFIHRQMYLPARREAMQQTPCLHHIAETRCLKHQKCRHTPSLPDAGFTITSKGPTDGIAGLPHYGKVRQ